MKKTAFGIDGCRKGWVICEVDSTARFIGITVIEDLSKATFLPRAKTINWIDMPLSFPTQSQPVRRCDIEARKLLQKRASTLFSPPTRKALYQESYLEASQVNSEITGKKISKQSWNLTPKIKEALRYKQKYQLIESHPELCLYGLKGEVVRSSKHIKYGIRERIELLQTLSLRAKSFYKSARAKLKAKDDDIIDAMILALSASKSQTYPKKATVLGIKRGQLHYWRAF